MYEQVSAVAAGELHAAGQSAGSSCASLVPSIMMTMSHVPLRKSSNCLRFQYGEVVFFCSVACQKQSWPTHKIECKKLCQKKGKASGGTSKARALQLIKDLSALPAYSGTFNDVASFGQEYGQWYYRKRALVLSGLHEICEHKERKTLKHALKHNVLDVFRDVVVQQATEIMRQAKALGDAGVLCLVIGTLS